MCLKTLRELKKFMKYWGKFTYIMSYVWTFTTLGVLNSRTYNSRIYNDNGEGKKSLPVLNIYELRML